MAAPNPNPNPMVWKIYTAREVLTDAPSLRHDDGTVARRPYWKTGFQVAWDTPNDDYVVADVTDSVRKRVRPGGWLQAFFDWYNAAKQQNHGARFQDLYDTNLEIGHDERWIFAQPLGRGGYGAVALFRRIGDHGEREDEIVVKTTQSNNYLAVNPEQVNLAREAALMAQTNEYNIDGMLYLRDYKAFPDSKQWRFYFEYCPHGDLERLRLRYRAYGRSLPETFLWHVFYWLAHTIHLYHDQGWRRKSSGHWGRHEPNTFLLHMDLKPQNVLLGDSVPGPFKPWAVPRIADLGLADTYTPNTSRTRAFRMQVGTHAYYAPELRYKNLDLENDFYPFGEVDDTGPPDRRKGQHYITSKANVFVIGMIMYQMLTLRSVDTLTQRIDDVLSNTPELPGVDDPVITEAEMYADCHGIYSETLRNLVRDCLVTRPDSRANEADLLRRATAGYVTMLVKMGNSEGGAGSDGIQRAADTTQKVYYKANEIDGAPLPLGGLHPPSGREHSFWAYFVSDLLWLPKSWGKLVPPNLPSNTMALYDWPQAFRDRWNAEHDLTRFDPDAAPVVVNIDDDDNANNLNLNNLGQFLPLVPNPMNPVNQSNNPAPQPGDKPPQNQPRIQAPPGLGPARLPQRPRPPVVGGGHDDFVVGRLPGRLGPVDFHNQQQQEDRIQAPANDPAPGNNQQAQPVNPSGYPPWTRVSRLADMLWVHDMIISTDEYRRAMIRQGYQAQDVQDPGFPQEGGGIIRITQFTDVPPRGYRLVNNGQDMRMPGGQVVPLTKYHALLAKALAHDVRVERRPANAGPISPAEIQAQAQAPAAQGARVRIVPRAHRAGNPNPDPNPNPNPNVNPGPAANPPPPAPPAANDGVARNADTPAPHHVARRATHQRPVSIFDMGCMDNYANRKRPRTVGRRVAFDLDRDIDDTFIAAEDADSNESVDDLSVSDTDSDVDFDVEGESIDSTARSLLARRKRQKKES